MRIPIDIEESADHPAMAPGDRARHQGAVFRRSKDVPTVNNLKVSTRLMLLISVLSVLLVAIGGLGLFGISSSNDALKSVYEDRTVPTAQLGSIRALQLANRLALNIALVTPWRPLARPGRPTWPPT
jgi:hypothetical protein